jgi:nucleotide-binding universal stress UspA family protein
MKKIKNILVATDFSPASREALDHAVALAEKLKASVYVLHAVDKIEQCAVDYCLSEEQIEAEKNKLLREARRSLNSEIGRYKGRTGIAIKADLRYGRALDEILREEAEKNIDLLVIGPHDKNTLWRRMTSRLSDRLAR